MLYACHRKELDDLVKELQQEVEDVLVPASQRGDRHSLIQAEQRHIIVMTWYKWSQELFSDAVGLSIGGPAFLNAFSSYLNTLDRGEFYRPVEELAGSAHPVTLLRIRLLEKRARQMGLSTESETILRNWDLVKNTMGVSEDYHGYYTPQLLAPIETTMNDMLTEVSPVAFSHSIANPIQSKVLSTDSPVDLVNKAWNVFETESLDRYMEWEQEAIRAWLS